MARTYRGVKQPLTIEVKEPLQFKMTALPSNWRQLRDIFLYNRMHFDGIIQRLFQEAADRMPPPKKRTKIDKNDFDSAFDTAARELELKETGKFYRGKHKTTKQLEQEIADTAKWFHQFFIYWKKYSSKDRSIFLELFTPILDVRYEEKNTKAWDTLALTMFCCEKFFGESPCVGKHSLHPFRNRESFRTTYLQKGPRYGLNLKKISPDELLQLTEDTKHPLHKLTDICRKLQK